MRLILVLGMLWSSAASAGVFETRFSGLGNSEDTCLSRIESTADRFSAVTGAQVLDFGCERDDVLRRLEGVLVYVADARLTRVSSYKATMRNDALYTSLEACEAALATQEDLFYAATGIEPVVSYCMSSTYRDEFTSRVDGFGETQVRVQTMGARYDYEMQSPEVVLTEMKNALQTLPLTVAEIGTNRDVTWGRTLIVRAYGETAYTLDNYDELVYASGADCLAAQNHLKTSVLNDVERVVTFCSVNPRNDIAKLHVVSVHELLGRNDVLQIRRLPRAYDSLQACAQVADDLGTADDDIYGAICGFTDDQFYVHLFAAPAR